MKNSIIGVGTRIKCSNLDEVMCLREWLLENNINYSIYFDYPLFTYISKRHGKVIYGNEHEGFTNDIDFRKIQVLFNYHKKDEVKEDKHVLYLKAFKAFTMTCGSNVSPALLSAWEQGYKCALLHNEK